MRGKDLAFLLLSLLFLVVEVGAVVLTGKWVVQGFKELLETLWPFGYRF